MEKITIKQIKKHAESIKQNGAKGRNAWNRLERYLDKFENVDVIDGNYSIYIRGSYRDLNKVVPCDFFFHQ